MIGVLPNPQLSLAAVPHPWLPHTDAPTPAEANSCTHRPLAHPAAHTLGWLPRTFPMILSSTLLEIFSYFRLWMCILSSRKLHDHLSTLFVSPLPFTSYSTCESYTHTGHMFAFLHATVHCLHRRTL